MINLELGLDRLTVDVGANAEEGATIDTELSDNVEVCALRVRSKDKRETMFWFINPEQVEELVGLLVHWNNNQRREMIRRAKANAAEAVIAADGGRIG